MGKSGNFLGIDNNTLLWILGLLGAGAAALFLTKSNAAQAPPSSSPPPMDFSVSQPSMPKKPGCGCQNKGKANVSNSMM